jgi:hypothetical protein
MTFEMNAATSLRLNVMGPLGRASVDSTYPRAGRFVSLGGRTIVQSKLLARTRSSTSRCSRYKFPKNKGRII